MALICHHPHLFWLTFPLTDWEEASKRGVRISCDHFVFTHSWRRTATGPKSNLDNLLPALDKGGENSVDFSNLMIAACQMLFVVSNWASDGFC